MSKLLYTYFNSSKSYKPFRVRKMGQTIQEFTQNINSNQMDNILNNQNNDDENRNLDFE